MKVVFIGAGNVATLLAKELYKYDFDIQQIYSRTQTAAEELANQVNAHAISDLKHVVDSADLYIFSVKDSILEGVLNNVPKNNGIWLHTAGSMPMDIFADYTPNYGVLYPFQTFSKDQPIRWENIPLFVEANNETVLDKIHTVAQLLSSRVYKLSSDERKYLHLVGVFACNFTNHMYTLSEHFLTKIDMPFEIVLPLIEETCRKVHTMHPKKAQTGPAMRYDENVINKHISLIGDNDISQIYELISKNIYRTSKE